MSMIRVYFEKKFPAKKHFSIFVVASVGFGAGQYLDQRSENERILDALIESGRPFEFTVQSTESHEYQRDYEFQYESSSWRE